MADVVVYVHIYVKITRAKTSRRCVQKWGDYDQLFCTGFIVNRERRDFIENYFIRVLLTISYVDVGTIPNNFHTACSVIEIFTSQVRQFCRHSTLLSFNRLCVASMIFIEEN